MRESDVLHALFTATLVFDREGKVLRNFGSSLKDVANVLEDDRLTSIRERLRETLDGDSYEGYLALPDQPNARCRAISLPLDNGEPGAILTLETLTQNQRIKLSGAEFDFVLSNMRQGFWRRNVKGAVVAANEYLASLLEYSVEEMIGRHASEFLPNFGELEGRREVEFVTKSGLRRRAIMATSAITGPRGRITGFVDVVTDISAEHALRTRLVAEVQKMSQLAMTDILTGVANRFEFQTELDRLTSGECDEPFGVVIVDLDRFKDVNDEYGHSIGDLILQEFAGRLRHAVRETDLVARLGGDEFAIILAGTRKDIAEEIVGRLRDRLRYETRIDGQVIFVSASIGWSHSDEGATVALTDADRKMYLDKRQRKRS